MGPVNDTLEIEMAAAAPSPGRMLRRAAMKHCPACGAGRLFSGWFRMADRCPGCGYQFAREEGFFLGAYVMNLAIAQGLVMVLAVIPTIVMLNANPDASLVPIFVAGLLGAALAPPFFYPWSKALWVAIELSLRPIDEAEPSDVRLDRPGAFG
jgi:uncharacterized protein (DUF983 family)